MPKIIVGAIANFISSYTYIVHVNSSVDVESSCTIERILLKNYRQWIKCFLGNYCR
jgi:hypothetical protein